MGLLIGRVMIPSEVFAEGLMNALIRYGLYIGAIFQLACLLSCITVTEEEYEYPSYDKPYSDSDEYSSEQSSPGHRASTRARRHEKKKRR